MIRRAVVVASLLLAVGPAAASATTELNVIPYGQQEPGAAWATTPGMLPASAQAMMYDRLTPLGANITPDVLTPSADGSGYFKSAKLLAPDDPSLITDQTVTGTVRGTALSARIRRDAYGVPQVYSDTDDGVIFGAGYVIAEDRNLLIDQARDNGLAASIDMPGVSAIDLVRGLFSYTPTAAVRRQVLRQQNASLRAVGREGRLVLRDLDTYIAGINTWYHQFRPSSRPVDRTDIYAINAIKAQYLGQGGGREVPQADFLDAARDRFGAKRGTRVYQDLRMRSDPETPTTLEQRTTWQTKVKARGRGEVLLEHGTFKSAGPKLAGLNQTINLPQASNILMVSGDRSATGRPLFAGGPQIGYNYPGLTLEMGLYGPHIRVRGATSAPFPGYMLIGRGENFAWTLTSPETDIIDTYAERLCDGSRTRYVYKGKCRRMKTVNAGTLSKGADSVKVRFRRTVHGPVIGYARVAGTKRLVALASKRSTYGRETVDQVLFRRLTFGQVKSGADFIAAAKRTPQTFNSFYASDTELAYYLTGRLPLRKRGVNPDLPVDGRGRFEWRGMLSARKHPQTINPASGVIVNWNNKPAPNWPASDSRFGQEGPDTRVRLLLRALDKHPKATLAELLGAENAGATGDPRTFLWPKVSAVLAKAPAPSPLAASMVAALDSWAAHEGGWIDADSDGFIDGAGQAVMNAVWDPLARAALCGRLGADLCERLDGLNRIYDDPPTTNQYAGWHQYMDKDLRALLGQPVAGRYKVRYCGNGDATACAQALWAVIEQAGRAEAPKQGTEDASQWRAPTRKIAFSPLPLIDMQYTNRPTGIHQVMQFAP